MMPIIICPPGGGSVRTSSFGYVSMEPVGSSGPFYVFLAAAVRPADLLLLQHQGPAYLKGATPFSFSYQVSSEQNFLD